MKRGIIVATAVVALAVPITGASAAPNEQASCVGTFSSFFAHGGGGTHRSDVAQDFAHNAHPAGRNVYSHVAKVHGSLEACFEQT